MLIIYRTLKDVGIKRIILRFRYELRKKLDLLFPKFIKLNILCNVNDTPNWISPDINFLSINKKKFIKKCNDPKTIYFEFLNEGKSLNII